MLILLLKSELLWVLYSDTRYQLGSKRHKSLTVTGTEAETKACREFYWLKNDLEYTPQNIF